MTRAHLIGARSGFVCIALTAERLDELAIPPMVPHNTERHRTAYTVTVDYKHGAPPSRTRPAPPSRCKGRRRGFPRTTAR